MLEDLDKADLELLLQQKPDISDCVHCEKVLQRVGLSKHNL
ncbi:hypothetical protein BDFB_014259 [Asbolus verrucosus]|uniref:Uncharacterized protein n=1 Tax=Asbolus verrucosus TaxID=1661398 RepID=A0A482VF92_ASBVE|nr:hypothetical protein BDFB_014259 [Asbolus verrucosus]